MMNYRNIRLPSSRILEWGKQGENKATRLSVDVSEFIERSEGTIAVSCCRPDGKKYPHDCTINDTTVEIELSSYDTQVYGILTIVVSWMCDERIVKSEIYCGEISRSISTSGEKPTPPFDGLIEQVCNAAIKTKESADRAEAAAERAENAGGIAEDAAQRAETAAERAENAGGITEETDPTVPAWAKQPTKPSYTADEVNARPADWKPTPQEIGAASAVDVAKLSGEITQLKDDVAAITPDDTTVDGKPWTSKKIVDSLCQPFEESGNPVQCYPVENYPLGVKVSWEPVQEGSGDPSPDNIRPIKGRDGIKVERCGENLLNIKPFNKIAKNGITFEYVPDGGIHIYGTATDRVDGPLFPFWHLPPGKYYSLDVGDEVHTAFVVQRNGKPLWITAKRIFEILAGDVAKYWYVSVKADTTIDKTIYPYIVPGTTAPTAYEPYIGDTYTAELPETIYGGELDWNTGVLTVDRAIDVKTSDDIRVDSTDTEFVISAKYNCNISYYAPCNCINSFFHTGSFYRASKTKVGYKTLTELKEALGDTPIQICYKLETPYTIQITPQQITALSGVNTLYTDSGDISVSGRTDMIWLTQSLIDRISALETAAVSE